MKNQLAWANREIRSLSLDWDTEAQVAELTDKVNELIVSLEELANAIISDASPSICKRCGKEYEVMHSCVP